MSSKRSFACLLLSLGIAACTSRTETVVVAAEPVLEPRPVSVEVEVYDPISNFVWQDVGVRILESDQEWSGTTWVSPYPDDWYYTDEYGVVFLDEYSLAWAGVGFVTDAAGRALLGPELWEDEALVVLEVDALGFSPVIVEVPMSWSEPDVFVSVPF